MLMNQLRLLQHLRDVYDVTLPYEQILRTSYSKFLTPESVVIDVGAHTGEHFESFIQLLWPKGYVVAFEPIAKLAERLRTRFASKRLVFDVHDVALSDFVGESDFVLAEGTLGESGLRERAYNQPEVTKPKRVRVRVGRLDDFTKDLSRVDYIKIDIEGGEIDCIKGGLQTVQKHRPLISAEYGESTYSPYGYQRKDLWELAQSLNYNCADIFGNIIETLDEWSGVCDQVYWDYYLVPYEKREWFQAKVTGTL